MKKLTELGDAAVVVVVEQQQLVDRMHDTIDADD